jgi:hypothetical protein
MLSEVLLWNALAFCTSPFAFAQESVSATPRGMVWISGGEFLMSGGEKPPEQW